ncbi:hypothetical protein GGTG_05157 [Gaeumannomyces tritici R3-111a-1]|uniref:Uncharacterized protein n=1 Tax=Gaeumannomyces tritici (strain R3-111a-1) TaxID=644352 RepID=J3NV45_GAET3|nr:hypothetical protein GGTG_05157 [Gaeumannomyces tritici R3-111a-1]EJT75220.1 hypothetical protein GGTG_05157 [Gaeumannomyces tritici R3-111a-1]
MPYLKKPKFPETTSFSLALKSLPLKSLALKAALSGANTNAVPLQEIARFVKLLKNVLNNFQYRSANNFALNAFLNNGLTFVTRKLFGQYGIKRFNFLNNFAGAKLVLSHLPKPFGNFNANFITNHVFAINAFKKFRTIIEAYWYTGVNGIILICLTIKTTVIKYRTLRIIIFKKGQINKVLIIALLEIDNFLQRKRVANTHIKRKKKAMFVLGANLLKLKALRRRLLRVLRFFRRRFFCRSG